MAEHRTSNATAIGKSSTMKKFSKKQTDRMYCALGSMLSRLEWKESIDDLAAEIKSALLEGADPDPLLKIQKLINDCLKK